MTDKPTTEKDDTGVLPWTIEDASCTNCGGALAWCSGVGRLVIRHANGEAICAPPTVAAIHPNDAYLAQRALNDAEAAFVALQASSPASQGGA